MFDFGIAKANAVGDVYNLTDVGLFEGTYFASEAGFALCGGLGGTALRIKTVWSSTSARLRKASGFSWVPAD